ncbi:MAG: arylamine N-acetyltransferase [Candidatus Limivivens sp.]|nr:arylamine N-acetyltransferase [Candidatus Limivivens sp.]
MKFDRETYLERIGCRAALTPNVDNLTSLIRCHLETVPFENLDCWYERKDVSLDIGQLYEKIVSAGRGGICFELNGLFFALLQDLGYECYPVGVRVQWMWQELRPVSHEGILVILNGEKYYCDVGFGGPGPKGLLCLEKHTPQQIADSEFLVENQGKEYRILRKHGSGFAPVLVFQDIPWEPVDFRAICYYYATHEDSRFVQHRIVNLCLPDGSLDLMDDTLTERRDGQVSSCVFPDEASVQEMLKTRFRLNYHSEKERI